MRLGCSSSAQVTEVIFQWRCLLGSAGWCCPCILYGNIASRITGQQGCCGHCCAFYVLTLSGGWEAPIHLSKSAVLAESRVLGMDQQNTISTA